MTIEELNKIELENAENSERVLGVLRFIKSGLLAKTEMNELRSFSRHVGVSQGLLSLVAHNKRKLPEEHIFPVAKALLDGDRNENNHRT